MAKVKTQEKQVEQQDAAQRPQGDQLPEMKVRTVVTSSCPSTSGQSTITYEFGVVEEGSALGVVGEPMFRITGNTGGGMFGKDWVPAAAIVEVLKDPANEDSIAARSFASVFLGKSINTQSFLLAALRHEGVVIAHPEKPRGYQALEVAEFEARMASLGSEAAAGEGDGKSAPAKSNKRPVLKLAEKKAASTKE